MFLQVLVQLLVEVVDLIGQLKGTRHVNFAEIVPEFGTLVLALIGLVPGLRFRNGFKGEFELLDFGGGLGGVESLDDLVYGVFWIRGLVGKFFGGGLFDACEGGLKPGKNENKI